METNRMEAMDENEIITKILLPSLLKAAGRITEAEDVQPSADADGAPAVLIFLPEGAYSITVALLDEQEDLYRYTIEEPGFYKWSFPSTDLPEELELFPALIMLYERLRNVDYTSTDPVSTAYELSRLPALGEVLLSLGLTLARTVDEENRPCLVTVENNEIIRFSYGCTIPERMLTVLFIETKEGVCMIPEFSNVAEPEVYKRLLGAASSCFGDLPR